MATPNKRTRSGLVTGRTYTDTRPRGEAPWSPTEDTPVLTVSVAEMDSASVLIEEEVILDLFDPALHAQALSALAAGDAERFLFLSKGNTYHLDVVLQNLPLLKAKGLYETALLSALIGTWTNHAHYSMGVLHWLITCADRGALLRAGNSLPGPGPFTVYRGVGGRGPARRVRGLSWTASRDRARWFAGRTGLWRLADPAVYAARVPREHVLAYTNERKEKEFLIAFPRAIEPKLVERIDPIQMGVNSIEVLD